VTSILNFSEYYSIFSARMVLALQLMGGAGWVKSLRKNTFADEVNFQPLIDPGEKT